MIPVSEAGGVQFGTEKATVGHFHVERISKTEMSHR